MGQKENSQEQSLHRRIFFQIENFLREREIRTDCCQSYLEFEADFPQTLADLDFVEECESLELGSAWVAGEAD